MWSDGDCLVRLLMVSLFILLCSQSEWLLCKYRSAALIGRPGGYGRVPWWNRTMMMVKRDIEKRKRRKFTCSGHAFALATLQTKQNVANRCNWREINLFLFAFYPFHQLLFLYILPQSRSQVFLLPMYIYIHVVANYLFTLTMKSIELNQRAWCVARFLDDHRRRTKVRSLARRLADQWRQSSRCVCVSLFENNKEETFTEGEKFDKEHRQVCFSAARST